MRRSVHVSAVISTSILPNTLTFSMNKCRVTGLFLLNFNFIFIFPQYWESITEIFI